MADYIHELAMLRIEAEGNVPRMSNAELMEKYLKTCHELREAHKKLSVKYGGTVI